MGIEVRSVTKILLKFHRDTLVKGFLSGYKKQEDEHPMTPGFAAAMYALLRLSLDLLHSDSADLP